MANFIANATGNISGSGGNPWAKEEAGSGATQLTNTTATNTTTSEVLGTAFTITNTDVIDGFILWCNRINTTGTVTVALALSGVDQQTCVVNASDLPVNKAPVFFKLGATVTGDGTANWKVGVKGSSAGNATFYNNGSNNWARILRQTATATPASTDTLWVCKELTGAGTSNARTVYADGALTAQGNITAEATNAGLFQITSTSHGRSTNDVVSIQNTTSKPTGNVSYGTKTDCGKWAVTVVDANNFTLQGSTFVAGYVSGGKWYLLPTQYGEIDVGFGGTLQFGISTGPAASTDYYLPLNGKLFLWDSATLNMGTSGTRIPSTSTATLEFLCTSNVQYGLEAQVNSTVNMYGDNTMTTAYAQVLTADIGGLCDLNASGAVVGFEGESFIGKTGTITITVGTVATAYTISSVTDATHLTLTTSPATATGAMYTFASSNKTVKLGSTTGMSAGDTVVLDSATQSVRVIAAIPNGVEAGTISSVDSATQVTLVNNCAYYHAGGTTSVNSVAIASHCADLRRGVRLRGISATNNAYVNIGLGVTFNADHAEFSQLGSNTATQRGIEYLVNSSTNISITYCTLHDYNSITIGNNAYAFYNNSTQNPTIGSLTFSHNVIYNIAWDGVHMQSVQGTPVFDSNFGCLVLSGNSASAVFNMGDLGSTWTNNIASGYNGSGFQFQETNGLGVPLANVVVGTNSGNVMKNCFHGCDFQSPANAIGTLSSWNIIRCQYGMVVNTSISTGVTCDLVLDSFTCFGCLVLKSIYLLGPSMKFTNGYFDAGPAGTATVNGANTQRGTPAFWDIAGTTIGLRFESCQISPVALWTNNETSVLTNTTDPSIAVSAAFINCTHGSTTSSLNGSMFGPEAGNGLGIQNFQAGSIIGYEKFNQVAGQDFSFKPEGTIQVDTTFYDASASDVKAERISPLMTTFKMQSSTKRVSVANGTAPTVSCVVRQSVSSDTANRFSCGTIGPSDAFGTGAYSGALARLMCRYNLAVGIGAGTPPADVVLATLTAVTGAITTATNASPIQITSTAHGLNTGDKIGISGALVNTAANGSWVITKVDANNFTLNGSTGNGAGTTGNWSKFVTLSGTPSTVTDDCCLEFYVDCGNSNGSAVGGFITVDSWKATGGATDDNGSEKYWIDGLSDTGLQTVAAGAAGMLYVPNLEGI